MPIELTDDGTMDTVLRCSECGKEMRYNYDGEPAGGESEDSGDGYAAFIEWAIEDATADHECPADDPELAGPQDSDITTEDHATFYQAGKVVLRMIEDSTGESWEYRDYTHADANGVRSGARYLPLGRFATVEQAIKAYMVKTEFWPNVWFISDHGNAHLIDLSEGK